MEGAIKVDIFNKKRNEKALIVKSNKIIEASYRFTINEQKIIWELLSLIQKEDTDFQRYIFENKDLYILLGIEHWSKEDRKQYLFDVIDKLQKRIILIHEGDKILKPAWIETPIFDEGNQTTSVRISKELKPYLLQLKKEYTSFLKKLIKPFVGMYSFRFYEICKRHEPHKGYYNEIKDGRYVKKLKVPLTLLRSRLQLEETEYKRFYDFKLRILQPSQKEVNAKTDMAFEFEQHKQGRVIDYIDFFITSKNPNGQVKQLPELSESDQPQEQQEILKRLESLGVADQDVKQAFKKYGLEKLEIAAEALEEEEKRKGLEYPNKALKAALEKGWKSKKRRRIEAGNKERKKEKEKREEIEAHKNLEKQLKDKKAKEENEKFSALNDEEKFDLIVSKHGYTGRLKYLTEENAEIFKKAVYENILSKYPDNVYKAVAYFGQELRKIEDRQEEERQREIEKRKLEEKEAKHKDKEAEQKEKDEYADLTTDEKKLERLLKDIDPSIYQGLNRANQDLFKETACQNIISEFKTLNGARAQMKVLAQKFYERQQKENNPDQDTPATQNPAKVSEFHQLGDILKGINKT